MHIDIITATGSSAEYVRKGDDSLALHPTDLSLFHNHVVQDLCGGDFAVAGIVTFAVPLVGCGGGVPGHVQSHLD